MPPSEHVSSCELQRNVEIRLEQHEKLERKIFTKVVLSFGGGKINIRIAKCVRSVKLFQCKRSRVA